MTRDNHAVRHRLTPPPTAVVRRQNIETTKPWMSWLRMTQDEMISSGSLAQTITSVPGRCNQMLGHRQRMTRRNPRPTDAPSYRDPGISHRYEWARILRSRRNIQRDAKSANHPIIMSGLSVCQTEDDDEENAQKRPRNVRVFPLSQCSYIYENVRWATGESRQEISK